MWEKAKNILSLFSLITVGGLLVLLKLKDEKVHALEIKNLKDKFSLENSEADQDLSKLRAEHDESKNHLDHDSPS